MEKVQENTHICKLCSKSFLCGRSLGGHMRSHAINDLKSVKNSVLDENSNYTLRENPKKSNQFSDLDQDDKLCEKCGKKFQSWKALFGHMKCHSDKVLSNTIDKDSDFLIGANRKLEIDNQLDDEIAFSKKKKRSRQGRNKYKGSSVISSISEIEKEQEEVALCLIMLSRDLGLGNKGFCSVSESSDNNFKKNEGKKFFNKKIQNRENGIETRKIIKKKKENKYFLCPICLKVFSSGQALGGHKRSHSIARADSEINQIIETREFLDLNLPPRTEEEEEISGLESWWVDSNNDEHEILLE